MRGWAGAVVGGRRSGACRRSVIAVSRRPPTGAPPIARRPSSAARHCWVIDPPVAPGRWPGIVLEWRQREGRWEGRVVVVVLDGRTRRSCAPGSTRTTSPRRTESRCALAPTGSRVIGPTPPDGVIELRGPNGAPAAVAGRRPVGHTRRREGTLHDRGAAPDAEVARAWDALDQLYAELPRQPAGRGRPRRRGVDDGPDRDFADHERPRSLRRATRSSMEGAVRRHGRHGPSARATVSSPPG